MKLAIHFLYFFVDNGVDYYLFEDVLGDNVRWFVYVYCHEG